MIDLDQGGASLPKALRRPAPADLAEWAEVATLHRGGGPGWRIVADDAPHLIYSRTATPEGDRIRLTLVGARSSAIDVDQSGRAVTAIVRLRPGALPVVAGCSGAELVDRGADWEEVTGGRGVVDGLAELDEAGNEEELLDELFRILRTRLDATGRAPVDWRVRALLDSERSGTPVRRAGERTGVSPRTLHRAVREACGLPPTHLTRIRRLHRALLDARNESLPGSRVAARHGYADQAHFIRECRAFLGETPRTFLGRRFS